MQTQLAILDMAWVAAKADVEAADRSLTPEITANFYDTMHEPLEFRAAVLRAQTFAINEIQRRKHKRRR